jgi:hypothetical protein
VLTGEDLRVIAGAAIGGAIANWLTARHVLAELRELRAWLCGLAHHVNYPEPPAPKKDHPWTRPSPS